MIGAEQALATLRDFVERSIGGYPVPLELQHAARHALNTLDDTHSDDECRCPTCGEDGGTSCGMPNCGLLA